MRLSDEQIRWFRLERSGLVEPFASPEAVASSLAGVQAQILPAALLALWNRSAAGAATAAEATARLFDARTLLRLWGQRHTLHLYATADWPLIQAAFAGRRTWWERQALSEDSPLNPTAFREGIARAAELLRARGTLSRKELRASGVPMPPELFSPWGGVFAELVRLGEACHAQWEGGEARYAHREHWLPGAAWQPPTADEANAELARRFFACYGPASMHDFAYWRAGTLAGEGRRAFETIADELVEVENAAAGRGQRLFARRVDLDELHSVTPEPEAWPVRMLGRFDPLLLAHKSKDWVVPDKYYDRVWRPAGHIEAVVLVHGRAVATWRYDRLGAGTLAVRVFPFKGPLPQFVGKEIRRQAKEVARFFGLKPVAVRVERTGNRS